jgi:hypothetical protein
MAINPTSNRAAETFLQRGSELRMDQPTIVRRSMVGRLHIGILLEYHQAWTPHFCSRLTSPAPPLGPSKYGPNIEKSPEHPLAPGTKEAFLLRQAALSGEGSELSKGKRLKRQPSFAGLGHARRSASFSAGESSGKFVHTTEVGKVFSP